MLQAFVYFCSIDYDQDFTMNFFIFLSLQSDDTLSKNNVMLLK